jgi:ABC-type Fe3+-siderophore transport system permease subunit
MVTEGMLATNGELVTAAVQTTTAGSGSAISWELLLLAGIAGVIIIALAWLLSGSSSSSD